ncbi:MAG: peptidoglycan bridge formation glycyltransferase FemA/FemB family protein [Anaerolineales bacterium]
MPITTWNKILCTLSGSHLLQSSQWAEVKTRFGWQPSYLVWDQSDIDLELKVHSEDESREKNPVAAALILERKVFRGLSVMYVPKGPILQDWSDDQLRQRVLSDLENFAKESGAVHLKIDPDIVIGRGVPGEEDEELVPQGKHIQGELFARGWLFSSDQIQFRNTFLIDLQQEEDQLLNRMKSKTRYNIRLASRKGISIRYGDKTDLDYLYKMYAETSVRGGFTIRGEEYYNYLWQTFMGKDLDSEIDAIAQPIIADFDGKPVAAAVMFRFGGRAWYLHGMSLPEHSDKMATYLIQWEGMRWAKDNGCVSYDMWGAPDQFNSNDSMWGVYRFKRGFGGKVTRTIGAWDFPVKPILYRAYTRVLPVILSGMRKIGNRNTESAAAEG